MDVVKNSILISKKSPKVSYIVIKAVSSRMFKVKNIKGGSLQLMFNYDYIWRHYTVKDPIQLILKKL